VVPCQIYAQLFLHMKVSLQQIGHYWKNPKIIQESKTRMAGKL